jgi:hypothetical protein
MNSAVEFRAGTGSWTDPTLVKSDLFYPPSVRNAEERLRFYAEHFNTAALRCDLRSVHTPTATEADGIDEAIIKTLQFIISLLSYDTHAPIASQLEIGSQRYPVNA